MKVVKKCLVCGKKFLGNNRDRVNCSSKCALERERRLTKIRNKKNTKRRRSKMKVKEVLETLKKMDPEGEVFIDFDIDQSIHVKEIKQNDGPDGSLPNVLFRNWTEMEEYPNLKKGGV